MTDVSLVQADPRALEERYRMAYSNRQVLSETGGSTVGFDEARIASILRDIASVALKRRPTDAQTIWVSEKELPDYFPYTSREFRKLRRDGVIKPCPDLRKDGKRGMYNLYDISARIRAGAERPLSRKKRLDYDPELIEIAI